MGAATKRHARIVSVAKYAVLYTILPILTSCSEPSPEVPKRVFELSEPIVDKTLPLDYSTNILANNWPPINLENSLAVEPNALSASAYYIVLDGSGSMNKKDCSGDETKMQLAKRSLIAFANALDHNANVGLAVFDARGLSERVPMSGYNKDVFEAAVMSVEAKGGTPLFNSIQLAYQQLRRQGEKQSGYGEYHLVIVTDGKASKKQNPSIMVDKILQESPVVLHTIGFCIQGDHSLNQPGRTRYVRADDADGLNRGLESILAESPDYQVSSFE